MRGEGEETSMNGSNSYRYTPGPWVVEDSRKMKRKTLRSNLLMVVAVGGGMPGLIVNQGSVTPTDEANARLIAAAPDLLQALKLLHDNLAEYQRINNLGGYNNHDMKMARAALAKAGCVSATSSGT